MILRGHGWWKKMDSASKRILSLVVVAVGVIVLHPIGLSDEIKYCDSGSSEEEQDIPPCTETEAKNGPPPFDAGHGEGSSSGWGSYSWHWNRISGLMMLRAEAHSGIGTGVAVTQLENGYSMNTGNLLVPRTASVKVEGYHDGKTVCLGTHAHANAKIDVVVEENGEEIHTESIVDIGCNRQTTGDFAKQFQIQFHPGRHYGIYVWARCEAATTAVASAVCNFYTPENGRVIFVDLIQKNNIRPESNIESVPTSEWHPDERTRLAGRSCDLDQRIIEVSIDPGDESDPYTWGTNLACRSREVSHQYEDPGTYTAKFCGKDTLGSKKCSATTVRLTCDPICEAFRLIGISPPV